MKLRAWFMTLLTAIGLAVFAVATPALADGCTPNRLCLFDGAVFSTLLVEEGPDVNSPNQCHNLLPTSARNRASSFVNSTDWSWHVATGLNCTGSDKTILAHTQGNLSSPFNNSIDSYYKSTYTGPIQP